MLISPLSLNTHSWAIFPILHSLRTSFGRIRYRFWFFTKCRWFECRSYNGVETEWKWLLYAAATMGKPTPTEIESERVDQFERWYALSNIIFVSSPSLTSKNDVKWEKKRRKQLEFSILNQRNRAIEKKNYSKQSATQRWSFVKINYEKHTHFTNAQEHFISKINDLFVQNDSNASVVK